MDKIDLKTSAIVILIISLLSLFYDPYLSLSLILGFMSFGGYYYFLNLRISGLLKGMSKFVFYLSIVASIILMALPFGIMTFISPTATHYVGCALGFIIFKIVLDIKSFINK